MFLTPDHCRRKHYNRCTSRETNIFIRALAHSVLLYSRTIFLKNCLILENMRLNVNEQNCRLKNGGKQGEGNEKEGGEGRELVSLQSECRELGFKLYERAYSWVRGAISITENTSAITQ